MRELGIVALCAALVGCATPETQDARTQMVGIQREQVLACMGSPAQKSIEGTGEVWNYTADNGKAGPGTNTAVNSSRFSSSLCNIKIVFSNGQVSAVNYSGAGGLVATANEQCARAINSCIRKH